MAWGRAQVWLAHAFGPPPDPGEARPPSDLPARLADEVRRWGLAMPASVAVEAHRPLLLAYAQAMHAAAPVLDALVPGRQAAALAAALEDPAAVSAFLARLEGAPPAGTPSPPSGAGRGSASARLAGRRST